MYLVELSQSGPQWQAEKPMEEQSLWGAHAKVMDELVDSGFIVLGGPLRGGGPRLPAGKTTFTNQLALELGESHGPDAPPFDVVKVNLQRVVSIPGFIGCVHDAMVTHPVKRVRRAAQRQIAALEKQIGFDIKVVKGSVKRKVATPAEDAETLHAQLLALRSLSEHLVVIFDEFQRLRHCPGDPLATIRSALMSSGANHVSLLFTGSIRNALKMMLEDSGQPIFGEAARMQLPAID